MITWKIWAVHRKASQRVVADVRFMGVMTAIVESGKLSYDANINRDSLLIDLCKK